MAPLQATLHEGLPKDTTSATTSPAQFNQPAETAALETSSLLIATNTAHDTRATGLSRWRRIKTRMRSTLSFRRKRGKGKDEDEGKDNDDDDDDPYRQDVSVYLLVGNHEVRATVKVMFDTGSPEDIISTSCLRDGFPGFAYNTSVGQRIGTSLTGCEELLSIAKINIRWSGRMDRARRSNTGPNYRCRVESSTCHVVESEEFDLIIGRPTIKRLKLFTPNADIFGGYRGVINVNAETVVVKKTQQNADARREEANEHKKLREKEKKDSKKATK